MRIRYASKTAASAAIINSAADANKIAIETTVSTLSLYQPFHEAGVNGVV